jgi:hypothetical protein
MRVLVLFVLASIAAPALADIGEGNWDMEVTMQMPGAPAGGQPMRQNQCLRAEEAKDPSKLFGSPGAGCQFIDRQDNGSTYRFNIVCSGPTQVTGTGEMNYSRDNLDGQIVLNMAQGDQKIQTRTTIKARRTGPCAGPK